MIGSKNYNGQHDTQLFMFPKFLLVTLLFSNLSAWDHFYSTHFDWSISNDGKWKKHDGTNAGIFTCPANSMQLMCTAGGLPWVEATFTGLPPHFQTKVIADQYILESFDTESVTLQLGGSIIFTNTYQLNTNMDSFYSSCGNWAGWQKTTVKTSVGQINHSASSITIRFSTTLDEVWNNEAYCFRNIQLFLNNCHYSCLTCNAAGSTNCLTCYNGGTPVGGVCPGCVGNTAFFQPLIGCIQECTRTGYHPDSSKFCAVESRSIIFDSSFTWALNIVPSSYDWTLYTNEVIATQRNFNCNNWRLVGQYLRNEYITKSLSLPTNAKKLRIRVSFYFFGTWNEFSSIILDQNNQEAGMIYQRQGQYFILNGISLATLDSSCTNIPQAFHFERAQFLFPLLSPTPILKFYATADYWSPRDIYIDVLVCAQNCATCISDTACSVCNGGFNLYKGECIIDCPVHSTLSGGSCRDFDEETSYSSYLVKAFYDYTAPETEAASLFTLSSSHANDFQKGQWFSYLRNRRIFGGPLTWLNSQFTKTFTLSKPHYGIRILFKLVLGDNFATDGSFAYTINSVTYTYSRSSTSYKNEQDYGFPSNEYFYEINQYVSHTSNSLQVSMDCNSGTGVGINDAFCGIFEYYIVVLECPTFCNSCTSLAACTAWSATPNFNSVTQACNLGYVADVASATCVAVAVSECGNGIIENGEVCDDGNQVPYDGCYKCKFSCSFLYPNCFIRESVVCQQGEYSNTFDNKCYPICGDLIIHNEEECDDGNAVPFDGCHNCKYSCQESCLNCIKGKCQKCSNGWKLGADRCSPICGDQILTNFEACEEKILYSLAPSCHACQLHCPSNCNLCSFGVCQNCVNGFKLLVATNTCVKIQNDSYITNDENCDDGNLAPFDGCHLGFASCQESCLDCREGKCVRCKSGWKLINMRCISICGDGIRNEFEPCDQGIYQLASVCFECQFKCPSFCLTCDLYGACSQCALGYQLDGSSNTCIIIVGDLSLVSGEKCDDGNNTPFDSCYRSERSCQEYCIDCRDGICYKCKSGWALQVPANRCTPNCGDGIRAEVEQCDSGSVYQFTDTCDKCSLSCQDSNCTACIYGICTQCSGGFELNQNRCFSVCGDGALISTELCEDGNLFPFDGCYECDFSCQESCLECRQGKCYRCKATFALNGQLQLCQPICGDGIRNEIEVCDDKIYFLNDVCLHCSFQCPSYCITCNFGLCSSCDFGFQLNFTRNQCEAICGDKQVVGQEECDDGNLASSDGCFDCRIECQLSCLDCRKGNCYNCKNGYELIHNRCQPICGDEYRCEVEACDDKIYQMNDFCKTCQFRCPEKCLSCQFGICSACEFGYYLTKQDNRCFSICGDGTKAIDEQCDDANLTPFDGCHDCFFQCQPSCDVCMQGSCQKCKFGYAFNPQSKRCEAICKDGYRSETEVCEDTLQALQYLCQKCDFLCPGQCVSCFYGVCTLCATGYRLAENHCQPICGDGLVVEYEECDDGNLQSFDKCFECQITCQDSCLECRAGKCYKCKDGWLWNQTTLKCQEICGDFQIVGLEFCDDSNALTIDQCYKCQYTCPPDCVTCEYGICQSCQQGFKLLFNRCFPIYNDALQTQYEECDDNNLKPFDGCHLNSHSCQYSCLDCRKGDCYQCSQGWSLSLIMKRCLPICGDGLIVDLEACDDSNNQYFDGCFQCKYFCPQGCSSCNLIGICLGCIAGLRLNPLQNQCVSIPADGLVVAEEICDDLNLDPFDSCHSNIFACADNCYECVRGKCMSCMRGYTWDITQQTCSEICGDGLRVGSEICDDGNVNPYDSCFKCQHYCEENCQVCKLGWCTQCHIGYRLSIADNICYPVIGDLIVTRQEDCDDENLLPFDGCLNRLYQCQEGCAECRLAECWKCKIGWVWDRIHLTCNSICGDGIQVQGEQCDDGNYNPFDGCFGCRFQCPPDCRTCILQGRCLECIAGYQLTVDDNTCQPICGDGLVAGDEECDSGKLSIFDGCQNCKLKCPDGCYLCLRGRCFGCMTGYRFVDGECLSICGDLAAISSEQCDDGNTQEYDGCHDCNFQCDRHCLICNYGQCSRCKNGFILDQKFQCQSVCGDGVRTELEYCDDGNDNPNDGCHKCYHLCSAGCTRCLQGECFDCESPLIVVKVNQTCAIKAVCDEKKGTYYDEFNNVCQTKCGDMIVAWGEQCDDGNNVRYDGCFECKFQCDEKCEICDKGKCSVCLSGYQILNGICTPVCGDGVLLYLHEDCDDGNMVSRDGCSFCKIDAGFICFGQPLRTSICFRSLANCQEYNPNGDCSKCLAGYFWASGKCILCSEKCETCLTSPKNCDICLFEGCTICEQQLGYYTDRVTKQCFSRCGDGFKVAEEECDDGNDSSNDGCSSVCRVESKFQCGSQGCVESVIPNPNGDWVNSTTENVIFLKYDDDNRTLSCDNLTVWIEQFSFNEFAYNITDKELCHLEFQYFKTIETYNLIHIVVPLQAFRSLQQQDTKEIILTPRKWIYYSDNKVALAESISKAQEPIFITLRTLISLALLSGSMYFFWGMLEIIFWIHYLYLLNIHHPINVSNFLLIFDVRKLLFTPNNMFPLNAGTTAPPKFIDKAITPLFISQIKTYLTFLALSVIFYGGALLTKYLIERAFQREQNYQKRKVQLMTFQGIQEPKDGPLPASKFCKIIYNIALKYKNSIISIQLSLLSLFVLDFLIGVAMQLHIEEESALNQALAGTTIVGVGFICYLNYKIVNLSPIFLKNRKVKAIYGSLYKGLDLGRPNYYGLLNIVRKVSFSICLVIFYDQPLIQTVTCCLSLMLNVIYVVLGNPFQSQALIFVNLIPSFCLALFGLLIVGLAINDRLTIMTTDQAYMVGWAQIAMLAAALIVQVLYLAGHLLMVIKFILRPVASKVHQDENY